MGYGAYSQSYQLVHFDKVLQFIERGDRMLRRLFALLVLLSVSTPADAAPSMAMTEVFSGTVPMTDSECQAARAQFGETAPCSFIVKVEVPTESATDAAVANSGSGDGCVKVFTDPDEPWCFFQSRPGPGYPCGVSWSLQPRYTMTYYFGTFRATTEADFQGAICYSLDVLWEACYGSGSWTASYDGNSCFHYNAAGSDPASVRHYFNAEAAFNGSPLQRSHGLRIDVDKWGNQRYHYF